MTEAVDLLRDHLKGHPDSEYRDFIRNVRRTYTRSHLKALSSDSEPALDDFDTWFANFLLFRVKVDSEVGQILADQPEFRDWYDRWYASWPREMQLVREALQNGLG